MSDKEEDHDVGDDESLQDFEEAFEQVKNVLGYFEALDILRDLETMDALVMGTNVPSGILSAKLVTDDEDYHELILNLADALGLELGELLQRARQVEEDSQITSLGDDHRFDFGKARGWYEAFCCIAGIEPKSGYIWQK